MPVGTDHRAACTHGPANAGGSRPGPRHRPSKFARLLLPPPRRGLRAAGGPRALRAGLQASRGLPR